MATKAVQELNEETRFIFTIVEDGVAKNIGTPSVMKAIFKYPDGSSVIKDAALLTDGSDGKIYYDSETGFLTPEGSWSRQGYVVVSTPRAGKYYSEVKGFFVKANIATVA